MTEHAARVPGPPAGLVFLGNGPAATGGRTGWSMDADIVFRCVRCGELMTADPEVTATCRCGALHKDASAGRFGSVFGDDAIEVFRRSESGRGDTSA